jgi:sodium-dependent phosphate transporter
VIILYGLILRPFVLRSKNSFQRAYWFLPFLVGLTFFVVVIFIIQTGNKNKSWSTVVPDGKAVWISIIVAVGMGLITMFGIMPRLKKQILKDEENERRNEVELAMGTPADGVPEGGVQKPMKGKPLNDIAAANEGGSFLSPLTKRMNGWGQNRIVQLMTDNPVARAVTYGARYDVHSVVDAEHKDYDAASSAVWDNAEVFDPRTERLFRYLQIFSAAVTSLAHGANDVSNSIGPYSAVYNIWRNRQFNSKSTVPEWILVLGGGGIVLGLATFGYKIMRVLGVKTVKLSNVRGFCAELSTAITVLVASRYGLPVSTTQVITGALLTLGLFEGTKGVNWRMMIRIFAGWVLTLVVAAFLSAGVTSLLLYSPNKMAARIPGNYHYG